MKRESLQTPKMDTASRRINSGGTHYTNRHAWRIRTVVLTKKLILRRCRTAGAGASREQRQTPKASADPDVRHRMPDGWRCGGSSPSTHTTKPEAQGRRSSVEGGVGTRPRSACSHHSSSVSSWPGGNGWETQRSQQPQPNLASEHAGAEKVSSSWLHSAHAASNCKPCRFLLSLVHKRPCKASQKKNLTFGGTAARHARPADEESPVGWSHEILAIGVVQRHTKRSGSNGRM